MVAKVNPIMRNWSMRNCTTLLRGFFGRPDGAPASEAAFWLPFRGVTGRRSSGILMVTVIV